MNSHYIKTEEVQHDDVAPPPEDASHHQFRDHEPSIYKTPQQVAEEALGKIEWFDDITGFLDCPGKAKHTTPDCFQDCRIRLDGTPTVFCHHQHCADQIKEANYLLRAAFNANLVRLPPSSKAPAMLVRPSSGEMEELSRKAAQALPNILQNHAWPLSEIWQESPEKLDDITGLEWRYYLVLYELDDVVWIGDTYESGSKVHAGCWRTVGERLSHSSNKAPGPFICTSTFRPGTYERKKEYVIERKFLVVEFDRIDETVEEKLATKEPLSAEDIIRNKTKSAAVFRWLKDAVGLRLRAIVDSGNKSLHAHFAMPPADVLAELEVILPALKCDPATFRPTQPVRMPGFSATDGSGRQQRLLYLDRATSEHPPCRLPSTMLPVINTEYTHARKPMETAHVADPHGGRSSTSFTPERGTQESGPSNSSPKAPPPTTASTSSSNSSPPPPQTADSTASSNSSPPPPPNADSTASSNSSPKAPPPPTTASTSSSNSSNSSFATTGWPNPLPPAAFHGIAGKIVRMIEPHTEADPAALLIHLLVAVGSIIGRNVFITADGARHHLNLFTAIVGETSKGRKGTSWNQIARLVSRVDEVWKNERVTTGLSSGEGVIWAVRDAIVERKPAKGTQARIGDIEEVIKDPGIEDKRLFVVEGELANMLKVMAREGNTLSPVIRQAWDGNDLNTLVKNSPAKSTAPHISIVGHITKEELLIQLRAVEAANGFANRFLWTATKRSKLLPEGGAIDEVNFNAIIMQLFSIIESAKFCGEVKRSEPARALWRQVYPLLSEGKPGMVGAITGRAEAQVMRLSAIYAVLDQSKLIEPVHHAAAMAIWQYSEETVRWIFGDRTGDKDADKILAALRRAGPKGLSRTDICKNVFSNNKSAFDLDEALQKLVVLDFAVAGRAPTETRTEEHWFLKNEVRI